MLGAKLLIIRPPATIKPLKIATGLAPKDDTHMLQTGPREKAGKTFVVNSSNRKNLKKNKKKKHSDCGNVVCNTYLNI